MNNILYFLMALVPFRAQANNLMFSNNMNQAITVDSSIPAASNTVLEYLVRKPLTPSSSKKAIILLHGVGSNEQGLFSLAGQLPDSFYIIAPRGQFMLGAGRYAWYNVDFSTGRPVYDTLQEQSSRKLVARFVEQVKKQYQLDEVFIGGFSQGAIMGYTIGLTQPQTVKGIIALGGRLLEEAKPLVQASSELKQLKVFVAHGIQDSTLPIHYARAAKNYLETLGIQPSYHEYDMGHQIAPSVIQDLNHWLSAD